MPDIDFGNPAVIIAAVVAALLITQLVFKLLPKPVVKRKPALPGLGWKIIYTDNAPAKEERKPGVVYGKKLTDDRHRVYGKPDFIYSDGRQLIPVELKSGNVGISPAPREGDLMQLAAYFYLAEAEFGLRARKGLLIYGDAMFVVRNTRRLRANLMNTIDEMQYILNHPSPNLDDGDDGSGASYAKCRYCPCRGTVCEIA